MIVSAAAPAGRHDLFANLYFRRFIILNKIDINNLPLVLKVEDLMPILSIGRNTAYELVRSGRIRSFRVGRLFRISREAVEEFLRNQS